MRLLTAMVFMSVLTASQARAYQGLDELLACRGVPESAARLECFDHASDAVLSAERHETTQNSSKPAAVESSIVRISKPVAGRVDFTLESGQVWRQMDADDSKSAKVGDRVVVSKAFLGAYWLKIEGGRKWRVVLVR
jgi:hypothetical protein